MKKSSMVFILFLILFLAGCGDQKKVRQDFIIACYQGDIPKAKEIINKNPALVKQKYPHGGTIFSSSYVLRHRELTELFIEKGADVKEKNDDGETPLHNAYHSGESAALLIAKGADVNAKDVYGRTPLNFMPNMARPDFAEALIKGGADINSQDCNGETALYEGCAYGNVDLVRCLLSHGADTTIKNKEGKTAHDIAQSLKRDEILALFKEAEAKKKAPGKESRKSP